VVCATMPDDFDAVGQVFVDFHQVSDDEVRDLLANPHWFLGGFVVVADAVVGRTVSLVDRIRRVIGYLVVTV